MQQQTIIRGRPAGRMTPRIVGLPEIRYTPASHDPHLLVQSNFGANLRASVLATPALVLARQSEQR